MDIRKLRREVETLQLTHTQTAGQAEAYLASLLRVFRFAEDCLEGYNQTDVGASDNRQSDWVIDLQSIVMKNAATTSAHTPEGVLSKLALWRWDAPDLDCGVDAMSRYDAVAYSAFCDIAKVLGRPDVLKPRDKAHLGLADQPRPGQLRSAVQS